MITFFKVTGFITLMVGGLLACTYPNLLPTVICWNYTCGVYGLTINLLEKQVKDLLPKP